MHRQFTRFRKRRNEQNECAMINHHQFVCNIYIYAHIYDLIHAILRALYAVIIYDDLMLYKILMLHTTNTPECHVRTYIRGYDLIVHLISLFILVAVRS